MLVLSVSTHLHIRITLRHSEPEIIRELEVPADYSVYELHLALQVSLGWNDLEAFEFVRTKLTVGVESAYAGAGLVHDGHTYRHADEVLAGELLPRVGQQATYTYDFSRLWEFRLQLLGRVERDHGLPVCTRVEEAAPIEDADNLEAFYGMLIAAADPRQQLHELALQFLGDDFNVSGPTPAEVSEALALLFGEEVEPHGVEDDQSDADWGWWDPSKYDDRMRLRVKQQEITDSLPEDLDTLNPQDKHAALLKVLRGTQS